METELSMHTMPTNSPVAHSVWKSYYSLTKPGIIYGNAINVIAGSILASRGHLHIALLSMTLVGISLVIGSGCVFNNYIDRDIDALMERTKRRTLVIGSVSQRHALLFATILGILGTTTLLFGTNILATFIALIGLFFYVIVYSLWAKRANIYGTLVGSISGAVPPVVGYVAVTGSIDLGAVLLFAILTVWQMPHSYAIAIYRMSDYANARIPILSVVKGVRTTVIHMIVYTLLFAMLTPLLYMYGYTGMIYLVIMTITSLLWFTFAVHGLYTSFVDIWAKKMFKYSILVVLIFAIAISINT